MSSNYGQMVMTISLCIRFGYGWWETGRHWRKYNAVACIQLIQWEAGGVWESFREHIQIEYLYWHTSRPRGSVLLCRGQGFAFLMQKIRFVEVIPTDQHKSSKQQSNSNNHHLQSLKASLNVKSLTFICIQVNKYLLCLTSSDPLAGWVGIINSILQISTLRPRG